MDTRLPLIEPAAATGSVKETLDELRTRTGAEPGPMVRGMAVSGALLRGYADLNRAVKRVHLDRRVSERISLAVQEWLGCSYCLDAHTRAATAAGVSAGEIALARSGTSRDPKVAALVAFGLQVAVAPGSVTDEDVADLRRRGWRDEQIADVVALVALNVLTGSFNLVAGIAPADVAKAA